VNDWSLYERLTVGPDEVASHRMERRLLERVDAHPQGRPRRFIAGIAATTVAAAAALALWMTRPEATRSLEQPATVTIASSAYSQRIALPNDGMLVVEPHSRVDLEASATAGARIRLHAGAALLDVRPSPGLAWIVEAGAFRIDTDGALFHVQSTADVPEIAVTAGSVRLMGPGLPDEGMRISADEAAASVTPLALPPTPVESPTPEVHADASSVTSARDDSAPESARVREERPQWLARMRAAVDAGDSVAAVAALPEDFPTGRERMSATELLDAGDALAAGYQDGRAERAYRFACRPRGTKACGVATFRTAILRARAGDHDDAIALATRYLDDHPDGSLAREVLGRRLQWHFAGGHDEAARADADLYLERWPNGPNAGLARRIRGGQARGQ
jgi:transmembrane sensor